MPVAEELTTPGPWRWSNEPYPNGNPYITVEGGSGCYTYREGFHMTGLASEANGRLMAAAPVLADVVRAVASAYPNDPGTSDLEDSQPVTISLGVVRQAWAALAKVDR